MIKSPYHWSEEIRLKAAAIDKHQTLDAVEVVLASDTGFLKYAAVTIATILDQYKSHKPLRIHLLLEEELSQQNRDGLEDLKKIHPYTLNDIVVDGTNYHGLRTTPGIPVATFFRLQMHEILPPDVTRVIYMDSDIVVRSCVSELFSISLGDSVIAGVEDTISRDYVVKLGQHPETVHINAGVLVLNLEAIRALDFTSAVESFLKAKRYTMMLGDQEVITGILGLVTSRAPICWNVHGSMFEPGWVESYVGRKNDMGRKEALLAIREPALIHYTYKRKPWIAPEHPKSREWFSAAKMTTFHCNLDNKTSGYRSHE